MKKKLENKNPINKRAILFILSTIFLSGIGFGIVTPVIPFIIQNITKVQSEQSLYISLLTFAYAFCMILGAPILGALSDRFGRKPILIISLFGTAIGYILFGTGSIILLFLGRIIDGLTGGDISTILAYIADITSEKERTRYFGFAAAAAGAGFALGPSLGGLLMIINYSMPMYFGALLALLNTFYAIFFMKESLIPAKREKKIIVKNLNPLVQLKQIISFPNIKYTINIIFCVGISGAVFQSFFAQFGKSAIGLTPAVIGIVVSIIGIQDILSQMLLMPILLRKSTDKQIMITGIILELIAYILMLLSALYTSLILLVICTFIYGTGDSLFGPTANSIISKYGKDEDQGKLQGGSQAVQSITKMIGPILGGVVYALIGNISISLIGLIVLIPAGLITYKLLKMNDKKN